jgi:hypothetical protein
VLPKLDRKIKGPSEASLFWPVLRFLILAKWRPDVVQAASPALVEDHVLRHCLPQFPGDCLSIIAMDADQAAPELQGPCSLRTRPKAVSNSSTSPVDREL